MSTTHRGCVRPTLLVQPGACEPGGHEGIIEGARRVRAIWTHRSCAFGGSDVAKRTEVRTPLPALRTTASDKPSPQGSATGTRRTASLMCRAVSILSKHVVGHKDGCVGGRSVVTVGDADSNQREEHVVDRWASGGAAEYCRECALCDRSMWVR